MRAVEIYAYGGPEVLQWRDVPVPQPGADDVLIRLAYSGINFMDVHTRAGKYARSRNYTTSLPLRLGVEGAGHVEAVGANVGDWHPGDRVAYCIVRGSYAEYAVVPAAQLVKVPEPLGLDLAAAALFQGITAHYLAHDVGQLAHQHSCLVHAGSGGIGQILIQLARQLGATVLATASSEEKRRIAESCGAAVTADYGDDFVAAARGLTGGAGVDVVFDSVGPDTIAGSIASLRRSGLLVLYGSNSGPVPVIEPMVLADAGSLYFTRPRLADHIPDPATLRRRAGDIFKGLLEGWIRVKIEKCYTFDTVQHAHSALEGRRSIGKSLLQVA